MRYCREDLAWVAGFYEGEGSISFRVSSIDLRSPHLPRRGTINLEISQVNKEPLERFRAIVPWSYLHIYAHKAKTSKGKPFWKYCLASFEKVQALCVFMWPWLSTKRKDQIRIALRGFVQHHQNTPKLRKVLCPQRRTL